MVAVKVAIDERCADEGSGRSFPDQTRMSAVIDHPNVLPVFHSGEHAGRPYLVMPHVFGVDLARQIAAQALTVRRVLALLGQVAAGLDAMHRCGLLHLDVKPANVLVGRSAAIAPNAGRGVGSMSRPPGDERVYLADLGLCCFSAERVRRTDGEFVGSPRYAAPEHLRGGPVRAAADIYALTCVIPMIYLYITVNAAGYWMITNVYLNKASKGYSVLNGVLSIVMLILGVVILVSALMKWKELLNLRSGHDHAVPAE